MVTTGAAPAWVTLNNAEDAATHLVSRPSCWGYLMAVELGYLPLGKAATALQMDLGSFYLLQAAAGETCKRLGKRYEFAT